MSSAVRSSPIRRVGFDLSPLALPASPGVRRATRELWRALSERDPAADGIRFVPLGAPANAHPASWRQWTLPGAVRRLDLDGVHATVSALPLLARVPLVQTVHELPWRTGSVENADRRHRFWARSARARATVVPSERTAVALAAERGRRGAPIEVVPWGVGAPFATAPPAPRGSRPPSFVLVGGTRPKKRLDRALAALARCDAAGDHELLVTGAVAPDDREHVERCLQLATELGLEARLRLVGHVEDAALADLLAHADASLVVSDSEGFGLGALESAAVGTPCVVATGSAEAEAAGSGALTFDPRAPDPSDAIAEALARSLGRPRAEREELVRAARTRTWDRAAVRVIAIWGTLLP